MVSKIYYVSALGVREYYESLSRGLAIDEHMVELGLWSPFRENGPELLEDSVHRIGCSCPTITQICVVVAGRIQVILTDPDLLAIAVDPWRGINVNIDFVLLHWCSDEDREILLQTGKNQININYSNSNLIHEIQIIKSMYKNVIREWRLTQ